MTNQSLRQALCQRRRHLAKATVLQNSQLVYEKLVKLPEFQQAKSIGAYLSINGEVDTSSIIQTCWQQQKKIYLPKILPQSQMEFYEYIQTDKLSTNQYGIAEPRHSNSTATTKLDLVLVPLVAFDSKGHRLGMGVGYYDRHFEFINKSQVTKPLLIGLAHSFQEVSNIEVHSWDVGLNVIITELDIKTANKKC